MVRAAPHTVFTAAIAAFALAAAASAWMVTRAPWPGVRLTAAAGGLRVESVAERGPAAGLLQRGEFIVMVRQGALSVPLAGLLQDPDAQTDSRALADQFARLQRVHRMMQRAAVELVRADGTVIRLRAAAYTPLGALLGWFWYQLLLAAVSLLTAASIGAFRPDNATTRRLTACGLALTLAVLSGAPMHPLVLGSDGELASRLLILEHLAELVFLTCLVGLSWSYPRRLPGESAMVPLTAAVAAIGWLIDTLALWHWLPTGFLLLRGGAYALAAVGVSWQCLRREASDGRNRQRAWLIALAVLLAAAAVGGTIAAGTRSALPPAASLGLHLVIYVSAAAMVYRRALFQVDRWVWDAWVLCGVGVAAFAVDAALVYLLQAHSEPLAMTSIAAIAWIYFPLRQHLWRRLSRQARTGGYRSLLPALIRELLQQPAARVSPQSWTRVLDQLFTPLHMRALVHGPQRPTLVRGGAELHVPAVGDAPPLALGYADRGRRRFSAKDRRLLAGVMELSGYVAGLKSAAAAGAREERRRVAAELHDRVMPRLLSFVYQADDTASAEAGRAAIRRLRALIQDLEASRHRPANGSPQTPGVMP